MPSPTPLAPTRRLTVIAQDPSVTWAGKIVTSQLEVPAEMLRAGPAGYRVHVIDYDSTRDRIINPAAPGDEDAWAKVNPNRLVGDAHFHAQNVYAIVMSTLSRFERALGRRVAWGFGRPAHQIKVVPHAFAEANAYYSRDDQALLFGYFTPRNKPVFTCLSHDIVAHEATHAILDGLRSNFLFPSSPDQAAFHEGFADVVALLSVFRQREVVDTMLKLGSDEPESLVMDQDELTVDALADTALFRLAEEMGSELEGVRGGALRASLRLRRDPGLVDELFEAHDRGEILVAAMLSAMLEVWVRRLFPNGDEGVLQLDRIHVVREGARAADHLLTMAIRALDYTPPVDLQFSDYLTALLTADTELNPDDSRFGYREALLEAFATFGIEPVPKQTAGPPGTWDPPARAVRYDRTRHAAMQRDPEEVFRFVWENRDTLRLEPHAHTYVESVRPTVRVNADGFLLHETVAEYVQLLEVRADELHVYGLRKPDALADHTRVLLTGGGALIFDDYGRLKLNVGSGVRSRKQQQRIDYLCETGYFDGRPQALDLARLHRLRGGGPGLRDPYLERRP